MSNDNVVKLIQPGILTDRLTEVLRDGARALLTQAVEAEVSEFLAATADLKTDGCRRVVRHGHLPERQIMTGIGPVAVRQPRVRDRVVGADDPARIRFTPAILPPYARRSKSLDTLIPILYLKGVSTGDFAPALAALLGKDAPGLSATTIARLKEVWTDEHKRWSERDLSAKSYVYVWADGVYLQARLEDEAQCILVIIGATPEGKKELLGFVDGARESAHDWRALLLDLKRRVCRWRPSSPSPMARSASGRRSASSGPRPVSNDAGCIRPILFERDSSRSIPRNGAGAHSRFGAKAGTEHATIATSIAAALRWGERARDQRRAGLQGDAGAKSLRQVAAAQRTRHCHARWGKWEAATARNILRRAARGAVDADWGVKRRADLHCHLNRRRAGSRPHLYKVELPRWS